MNNLDDKNLRMKCLEMVVSNPSNFVLPEARVLGAKILWNFVEMGIAPKQYIGDTAISKNGTGGKLEAPTISTNESVDTGVNSTVTTNSSEVDNGFNKTNIAITKDSKENIDIPLAQLLANTAKWNTIVDDVNKIRVEKGAFPKRFEDLVNLINKLKQKKETAIFYGNNVPNEYFFPKNYSTKDTIIKEENLPMVEDRDKLTEIYLNDYMFKVPTFKGTEKPKNEDKKIGKSVKNTKKEKKSKKNEKSNIQNTKRGNSRKAKN
tara:strand:- start:64 stop:852 length:789 start_codon:yes stop_codon:yes gene_type:complete